MQPLSQIDGEASTRIAASDAANELGAAASPAEHPLLRRRPRLRRGMYILPSLFTSVNIAAGYYAITESMQGSAAEPWHFNRAALAIGFAIPFDAIDGRVARMTKTTSAFGKELDSLADVITFGVAPSILAYAWGFRGLPAVLDPVLSQKLIDLGAFVCFLFLICGAGRLARFNISADPLPRNPGRPGRKYFVGMPIPAAAGVVAAVVHFAGGDPVDRAWQAVGWMCLVGLIGFLMVSRWRFWSGKEINLADRRPFRGIVLVGMFVALAALFSQWVLLLCAFVYLFSGIVARLAYSWSRDHAEAAPIKRDAARFSPGADGSENQDRGAAQEAPDGGDQDGNGL